MKLTKVVPAHTVTIRFDWINHNGFEMSPEFRKIRGRSRNPLDKCYWCGHKFADGEIMALGCISGKGNKVFCQSCANKIKSEEGDKP